MFGGDGYTANGWGNALNDLWKFSPSIVCNPPVIVNSPASQTVCSGNYVAFTSTVVGSNLSFQWQKAGVDITGAACANPR